MQGSDKIDERLSHTASMLKEEAVANQLSIQIMADAQFSLVLFASSTAFSVCILSPTLVTVAPTPWLKVKSDITGVLN